MRDEVQQVAERRAGDLALELPVNDRQVPAVAVDVPRPKIVAAPDDGKLDIRDFGGMTPETVE